MQQRSHETKEVSNKHDNTEKHVLRRIVATTSDNTNTASSSSTEINAAKLLKKSQREIDDINGNKERLDFSLKNIDSHIISENMKERLISVSQKTNDNRIENYHRLASLITKLHKHSEGMLDDAEARISLRRAEILVSDMLNAPPYSVIDTSQPLMDISKEFTRIKTKYDKKASDDVDQT